MRKGFGNSFQDDIARVAGQLFGAMVPVGDAPLVVNEIDTVEEVVTKLLLQGGNPILGQVGRGVKKGQLIAVTRASVMVTSQSNAL